MPENDPVLVNEEDINYTLDKFAKNLLDQKSFLYIAKIKAPKNETNLHPTGFCYEVGYNALIGQIILPEKTQVISPNTVYPELYVNFTKKGITHTEARLQSQCSTEAASIQMDWLIGGGGLKDSFNNGPGTLGVLLKSSNKYFGL